MARHSTNPIITLGLIAFAFCVQQCSCYFAVQPKPLKAAQRAGTRWQTSPKPKIEKAQKRIANYRPLQPCKDEPLDVRCALLHISARKAIKSGKIAIARRFYRLFVYGWRGEQTESCIAHTYFLWGLLEQRARDYAQARQVFKEAISRFPSHGRLYQAWALMESKVGSIHEARKLISQAVECDQSLKAVLKWKLWEGPSLATPAASGAAVASLLT